MSEEEIEKWTIESRKKSEYPSAHEQKYPEAHRANHQDLPSSLSCSSFEVLDPHDPVISRLATQLFKKTNDYLQDEVADGQEHYVLLEQMNRLTITKYTDLKNIATNLNKIMAAYNDTYMQDMKPLLDQIDLIDVQVAKLEANAYRLDSYTKQLKAHFKELEDKWLTRK